MKTLTLALENFSLSRATTHLTTRQVRRIETNDVRTLANTSYFTVELRHNCISALLTQSFLAVIIDSAVILKSISLGVKLLIVIMTFSFSS